jgi:glutamine amidotransferase
MLTLVNYGLGNISAFGSIYKRLNIPFRIATSPGELQGATHLILPGVGSFDWAMAQLQRSGLRDVLDDLVLTRRVPVLGICVGMQMMTKGSEEGSLPGLAWVDADVRRLDETALRGATRLPHMGWNDVLPMGDSPLFRTLNEPRFYFLHSYYFHPGVDYQVSATCSYGKAFACAFSSSNVHGVQFHPEKSHGWGVELLKNFAEI